MFNPFYNYISPDQGYYTQQPATVDQVNNIWHFVQKMRRELSKAIIEFNKYPDRQDEIAQNVQSITDQLKLVQQQLEKLKGADEKASVAIDELEAAVDKSFEDTNLMILERLKDVNIITPESGSVLPVKKITGSDEEYTKQITFTSTEDESAIDTNISGSEDVVNITQSVPGLLPENLAPRFTVENAEDGFTAKIDEKPILKLEAESLDGDLVAPHIENVNDGEYQLTVSSDGVVNEIARLEKELEIIQKSAVDIEKSRVLTHTDLLGNPDGHIVWEKSLDGSNKFQDAFYFTPKNPNLLSIEVIDDYDDKSHQFIFDVKDQFAISYPTHDVRSAMIEDGAISISTVRYFYDKKEGKVKASQPFDTKKLTFATVPDDKHSTYFEVDQAGNVTINTAAVENRLEKNTTAATSRMDALQARLVELEEKVRRLETRAVNQITSSNIRVEPRQGDKLAIILENYYANGKHEEKQATINFTSQDGALVFHTRDQGITAQTEMFINMNNEWLEKQGLKSTTNA